MRAVEDVKSQTGMRTKDAIRKLQKDKPGDVGALYRPKSLCALPGSKAAGKAISKAVERARERMALGQPLPLDTLVDLLPTDEN